MARLVRIHPIVQTTYGYLRLELYGCPGIEISEHPLEGQLLWICRHILLSTAKLSGVALCKEGRKSAKNNKKN